MNMGSCCGAGEFDERVFRGLDWLIAQAAQRHLRLILTLTNYWEVCSSALAWSHTLI